MPYVVYFNETKKIIISFIVYGNLNVKKEKKKNLSIFAVEKRDEYG